MKIGRLMVLTYLDSGVVIALFKGEPEVADKGWALFRDPDRKFIAGVVMHHELLTKPLFFGRRKEAD